MKECDTLRDDLKAYADGELGSSRSQEIERHLHSCEECREEVAAMNRISHEFFERESKAESDSLNPALRARILAGLPDLQTQTTPSRTALWKWWQKPTLGLAGAAVVALIVGLLWNPMTAPSYKRAAGVAPDRLALRGGGGGGDMAAEAPATSSPLASGGGSPSDTENMPNPNHMKAKEQVPLRVAAGGPPPSVRNSNPEFLQDLGGARLAKRVPQGGMSRQTIASAPAAAKPVNDAPKSEAWSTAPSGLSKKTADKNAALYDAAKPSGVAGPPAASHAANITPPNQEVVLVVDKLAEKKAAAVNLIKEAGGTIEAKTESRAMNLSAVAANGTAIVVQVPEAKAEETIANLRRLAEDGTSRAEAIFNLQSKGDRSVQSTAQNGPYARGGQGRAGIGGGYDARNTREYDQSNKEDAMKKQARGKSVTQNNRDSQSRLQQQNAQNNMSRRSSMPQATIELKPAVATFTVRFLEKQKVAPASELQQKK
jgi:hypothetical protein